MVMIVRERIPRKDWGLWCSLFLKTGGRFISDPYLSISDTNYWAAYEIEVEKQNWLNSEFKRLTTPIVERTRGRTIIQKIKKLLRVKV